MMETDGGAQAGIDEQSRETLSEMAEYYRHRWNAEICDAALADEALAWVDGLAAQVAALTAARDGLLTDLIHFAQTNHQAHHGDHSGTWLSCDRGSCPGLRRAVSRARGATTPPAGAQEIAPEASEPMEQCEWCGRQYPRSEMNTMPWPDDEHTRRICDRCVDEPN
ncbi:MAG: hypothetical protein ACTHMU_26510 [Thermomicrobiales bacterium]